MFKQIFLYLRLEQLSKNFLLFTPLFFIDSNEIDLDIEEKDGRWFLKSFE